MTTPDLTPVPETHAATLAGFKAAALALVEDQRPMTTATAYIPIRRLLEALVYAVLSLAPAEQPPVTVTATAPKPAAKRAPKAGVTAEVVDA